jgi:SPRY domain
MAILQTGFAQAAAAGSYQIARSLRFNSADSAYLGFTPSVSGNRKIWTLSVRVKRSALGRQAIFANFNSSAGSGGGLEFNASDQLRWTDYAVSSATTELITTQLFRDLSAWYDIVLTYDTTQATAANRIKLSINGTQVSAFATATYPSLNYDGYINTGSQAVAIGRTGSSATQYLNAYLTDIVFVDGTALDASSFGETDTNTGVWIPKAYSGSYGTNGFWLKFDDNSGVTSTTLGKDSSGNSNNWTPNNFSVTAGIGNDSLVDTPTNYGTDTGAGGEVRGNYPTWNRLLGGATPLNPTLSDGNLNCTVTNTEHAHTNMAAPTTGKWYWEFTLGSSVLGNGIGIALTTSRLRDTSSYYYGALSTGTTGRLYVNGGAGTTYGANYTTNDVIGVALNLDAGTLTFYKNGTSQGVAASSVTGAYDAVIAGGGGQSMSAYINFGQRPFAYTAPSGFKALCSANLPTPAVVKPSTSFDVALYTGTGSSLSISSLGFQPDFTWIKGRSGATDHALYDAVRGVQKDLVANSTAAETTQAQGVTAFGSTGFTIGTLAKLNTNAATYASWNWKAGGTGSSNTSGTITSTVSANTAAGISVIDYTANGINGATVGHGLGVAPAMMLLKRRGAVGDWIVYHKSLGATKRLLFTTAAEATTAVYFNNTAPTSSVLTLGNAADVNTTSASMISYCFAEVDGFSKFGSYTGNGSADGPFIYCGFRPRWILIKKSSAIGEWTLFDTSRAEYNVAKPYVYVQTAGAEGSSFNVMDILSNGFKIRVTDTTWNLSGATFVFAAFAEAPFNYSRAR